MPLDTSTTLPDEEPFSPGKYLSMYPNSKYTESLQNQIEEMRTNWWQSEQSIKSFKCLLHMQIHAFLQSIPQGDYAVKYTWVSDIDYNRRNHVISFEYLGQSISIKLHLSVNISDNIQKVKQLVADVRNKNPSDFAVSTWSFPWDEKNVKCIITSSTWVIII